MDETRLRNKLAGALWKTELRQSLKAILGTFDEEACPELAGKTSAFEEGLLAQWKNAVRQKNGILNCLARALAARGLDSQWRIIRNSLPDGDKK